MDISTDVLYDKETCRVIAIRYDEMWVLPNTMGLAQFRKGAEPVLCINDKGEMFFKPNALILKSEKEWG